MDTDSRKVNRKPPIELHAALHSVNKLRDVGVAGVEAGVCIHNTDYGSGECVFSVAEGFDEDFA